MKRRDFIKAGAVSSSAVVLGSLVEGCSDRHDNEQKEVINKKSITTILKHNITLTPKDHYNLLGVEDQNYIQEYLPFFTPVDKPSHSKDDEFFVANPGAKKLTPIIPSNAQSSSDDVIEYRSTSDVNTQGYIVHMYYKKIVGKYQSSDDMFEAAYKARGMKQDKDDVLADQPPKYKLSYLVLVVPDGIEDEERIIINPVRETVKALLYRSAAFASFTQDQLYYALSLFDKIFPNKTQLETMIDYAGMDNWFRYALYRDKENKIMYRKTQTLDAEGNVIHAIGDPIYTYPMRDIFADSLVHDHKYLLSALSADEKLSSVIMPKNGGQELEDENSRIVQWRNELLKRDATYNGHTYKVNSNPLKAMGANVSITSVDSDGIHLSIFNHYRRHLGVSHLELDEKGCVYDWQGEPPKNGCYIQHDVTLPARYTAMGIPLADAKANIIVPFRDGASATRLYFSSWSFVDGFHKILYFIHQNPSVDTDPIKPVDIDALKELMSNPEALTIVFDLSLPAALIAWGGMHISQGSTWQKLVALYGFKFAYDIASPILSNADLSGGEIMNAMVGPLVSDIIAGEGEIAAYILQQMVENEVEDAVPIAGQIFRGLCILANISNLAQTIYALSVANAVENIDILRYHTLTLNIRSDENDFSFPNGLTKIDIILNYHNGNQSFHCIYDWDETKVQSFTEEGGGSYSIYTVAIEDQPSGGLVDIQVSLSRGNWIAAHATVQINSYSNEAQQIIVTNNLVSLSKDSVYQHYAKLTNDGTGYKWEVKKENTTLPSPTLSDKLLDQNQLLKISVNDPIGAIGYSFRSLETNKYIVKNISAVLETPNKGVKSYSTEEMVQISYSLLSHKSNEGNVIFEKKDGVTYIRKIDINPQSNDFEIDFSKNIGQFISENVTQFGYYQPSKIIAALDTDAGVIHIINHLNEPISDTDKNRYKNVKSTPVTVKLGVDMDPTTQYFYNPKLLTMSPTGDIIVLEETHSGIVRLRAFERNGYVYTNYSGFNNGTGIFTLKKEEIGVTYLDISIESKGYIYVLKRIGSDATNEQNYQLDIYDPHSDTPSEPMVVTSGVSGGKMIVDYWRRVYTLNYETNALNEPTVSLWIPPV